MDSLEEKISRHEALHVELEELREEKKTAFPEEIKRINGVIRGKSITYSRLTKELAKLGY